MDSENDKSKEFIFSEAALKEGEEGSLQTIIIL